MVSSFIERVPVKNLNRDIARWKRMVMAGWDVTVLLAPDEKEVVAFGWDTGECREPTQLVLTDDVHEAS